MIHTNKSVKRRLFSFNVFTICIIVAHYARIQSIEVGSTSWKEEIGELFVTKPYTCFCASPAQFRMPMNFLVDHIFDDLIFFLFSFTFQIQTLRRILFPNVSPLCDFENIFSSFHWWWWWWCVCVCVHATERPYVGLGILNTVSKYYVICKVHLGPIITRIASFCALHSTNAIFQCGRDEKKERRLVETLCWIHIWFNVKCMEISVVSRFLVPSFLSYRLFFAIFF